MVYVSVELAVTVSVAGKGVVMPTHAAVQMCILPIQLWTGMQTLHI